MTNDTSPEHAIDVISKEAMQQFENVRQEGPCNMLDYKCVLRFADSEEMYALASLLGEEYDLIIKHYSILMKFHKIKRGGLSGSY